MTNDLKKWQYMHYFKATLIVTYDLILTLFEYKNLFEYEESVWVWRICFEILAWTGSYI
jgi:hypothetical protein